MKALFEKYEIQKYVLDLNKYFGSAEKTPTHAFVEFEKDCAIACQVVGCHFRLNFINVNDDYKLAKGHEMRHSCDSHEGPIEERQTK